MTTRLSDTRRPPYYTPAGYARLRARIERAREDYLAVCRTNEEAAGAGDSSVWHDNFAYEENQRRMHQLAARVAELEHLARATVVVPPESVPTDRVAVGSRVSLRIADGREVVWEIAGFDDGDPAAGRVSYLSALGRALVGASEGEVLTLPLDGREVSVEIAEILPPNLEGA